MPIERFITLDFKREQAVSPYDSADDKYPESFPRYFIERLTRTGDKIFDPFMGHGTTAYVAEALGRIPYGIEADQARFEWSAGQSTFWAHMRCADAGDCAVLGLPKMDFCVTSPPFMAMNHRWNPLAGGDPDESGYERYLARLSEIFSAIKMVMKKNALMVVHVDNIAGRSYTPLVRDFSNQISAHFRPVGETVIRWTGDHVQDSMPLGYALIFKNSGIFKNSDPRAPDRST